MQQYVIWQQPVLHFMHCYDNHITTKSQCGVRCTKINIPIPYLVYASPTPGRKSWHNIMKQKSQSHKTTLKSPKRPQYQSKATNHKVKENLCRNQTQKFKKSIFWRVPTHPHSLSSSSQLAFCQFGQPNVHQPGVSEEQLAAFASLFP